MRVMARSWRDETERGSRWVGLGYVSGCFRVISIGSGTEEWGWEWLHSVTSGCIASGVGAGVESELGGVGVRWVTLVYFGWHGWGGGGGGEMGAGGGGVEWVGHGAPPSLTRPNPRCGGGTRPRREADEYNWGSIPN